MSSARHCVPASGLFLVSLKSRSKALGLRLRLTASAPGICDTSQHPRDPQQYSRGLRHIRRPLFEEQRLTPILLDVFCRRVENKSESP